MDDKLAQSLSAYLGRDIRIAFESAADTALVTPARRRAMAEQDKSSRAAAAFEEDPAVKNLRQRFGAEVDPASVKPAN
jgi:DNA polymerase-3 subunit gamma/tau